MLRLLKALQRVSPSCEMTLELFSWEPPLFSSTCTLFQSRVHHSSIHTPGSSHPKSASPSQTHLVCVSPSLRTCHECLLTSLFACLWNLCLRLETRHQCPYLSSLLWLSSPGLSLCLGVSMTAVTLDGHHGCLSLSRLGTPRAQ